MKFRKIIAQYIIFQDTEMIITTEEIFFRSNMGHIITQEEYIDFLYRIDDRYTFDQLLADVIETDGEFFKDYPVNDILHDIISE